MLSILIPTYNYNIVNLVEIVHKQALNTNIPFEIIVVDDCSNNKNYLKANKVIKDLEFCTYIQNKKNLGRTETRNLLALKSSYELLLFLDADVLPKYDNFITRFDLINNKNCKVIFGGVCYDSKKPSENKILRWKYGHKRETKTVFERIKDPYTIVSSSLLINKNIFYNNNTLSSNTYGLDILFSGNLKKNNVEVIHIDNPVYHLGLESSSAFLKKSLEAVKSTFLLEKEQLIENNIRPLQKSYLLLKKWKLAGLFHLILKLFNKSITSNLLSRNPSIFLFDLYRLNYFIELKNSKND